MNVDGSVYCWIYLGSKLIPLVWGATASESAFRARASTQNEVEDQKKNTETYI